MAISRKNPEAGDGNDTGELIYVLDVFLINILKLYKRNACLAHLSVKMPQPTCQISH